MGLAFDIGRGGVVLRVQRVELLVETMLGGDTGIDRTADPFDRRSFHDRAVRNTGSEDTSPNNVMDERNLKSSGLPRISLMVLPSTAIDEVRTLPEPGSQDAMPEIGDSLLARADGKPLCHRAIPEARKTGGR